MGWKSSFATNNWSINWYLHAFLLESRGMQLRRTIYVAHLYSSKFLIPREARPKASRSEFYNFVPQRPQAGWNLVWSLRSYLFIYLFICEVGVCRKWRHTAVRWRPNGVRRRKSGLRAGVRILQGVFFSSFFFFFFLFRILSLSLSLSFFPFFFLD